MKDAESSSSGLIDGYPFLLFSFAVVDCGNPSTGTQATFSGSLYTYKSSIVYTCNLGYHISGLTASDTTVRSTCLASGLWNQTAPSCQSKPSISKACILHYYSDRHCT